MDSAVADHKASDLDFQEDSFDSDGQPGSERDSGPRTLTDRLRERLSSLKAKLIVPYLLLTLLTAMVGTFIVTRLVTSSLQERFFNQLYEASRVAADGFVRQEQTHLTELRLMAFTEGVAQAFEARDADRLQEILWPLALNNQVEALTAVNLDGSELLTLAQDPATGRYGVYQGTDFGAFDIVNRVLANESDELGDKFAGLLKTRFGYYLYTSAPVRDEGNNLVGVLLIGTRLESLLNTIKTQALADIVILDQGGVMLASTFASAEESRDVLELTPASIPGSEEVYTKELGVAGREYQVAYSAVEIRKNPVGLMGVALPSNWVVNAEATSRNTFSLIFSLATLAVIIIGYLLSQSIARPILKLRSISKAIAEGDLNQRTGFKRSDEIGELAAVFDLMTFRLRKRTDQASRLYQETLERNRELAEINARLQSTQQQLIQSEKLAAIGQLTAGIVHDVKNPLAVIKGLAEELREEVNLSSTTKEQLTTIRESANRATKIVTDLLKFAGQSESVKKYQDLCETIRTALRLTDYLSRKGSIKVEKDLPIDPVMVTYDATQIEQVLVNLFQNAIQAMPKGGTLKVRLWRTENGVAIKVEDNGVGIPKQYINRIFDPFFTTKSEGEGTGLGLSVSYGIISDHHGRIEVQSESGKGTEFTISLPYEQPRSRMMRGI